MEKKNNGIKSFIYKFLNIFLDPILAIIFSLGLGAIIIEVLGYNVGEAYQALWTGAFGNIRAIGQTLLAATPLAFTGMAFSMAFRCGQFNIGGEGQLYIGAMMGAWAGFAITGLPPVLHIIVIIVAGAAGGMLVALVPAVLKAKRGVNEVIIGIMMNYIAINITNYLVGTNGPLRLGSTLPATPMIQSSAKLPVLIPGTGFTGGYIIAILFAVAFYFFIWRTRDGYKIRAVGQNPFAAECGGIPSVKYSVVAMLIAGGLAGVGGSVGVIGVFNRFYANFSPGYGYYGIAVGMLGTNHPFGILLSSLLFGALQAGSMSMQIKAGTNAELVEILQALVIFFIAGKWSILALVTRARNKRLAKAAAGN